MERQLLHELVISHLKEGLTQKEISIKLKSYGYKYCSLSSIEKELKFIRDFYGAKTMFHLGFILSKRK